MKHQTAVIIAIIPQNFMDIISATFHPSLNTNQLNKTVSPKTAI